MSKTYARADTECGKVAESVLSVDVKCHSRGVTLENEHEDIADHAGKEHTAPKTVVLAAHLDNARGNTDVDAVEEIAIFLLAVDSGEANVPNIDHAGASLEERVDGFFVVRGLEAPKAREIVENTVGDHAKSRIFVG